MLRSQIFARFQLFQYVATTRIKMVLSPKPNSTKISINRRQKEENATHTLATNNKPIPSTTTRPTQIPQYINHPWSRPHGAYPCWDSSDVPLYRVSADAHVW